MSVPLTSERKGTRHGSGQQAHAWGSRTDRSVWWVWGHHRHQEADEIQLRGASTRAGIQEAWWEQSPNVHFMEGSGLRVCQQPPSCPQESSGTLYSALAQAEWTRLQGSGKCKPFCFCLAHLPQIILQDRNQKQNCTGKPVTGSLGTTRPATTKQQVGRQTPQQKGPHDFAQSKGGLWSRVCTHATPSCRTRLTWPLTTRKKRNSQFSI